MKLSYVRLLTEHFDESFEFFNETLGFKVIWGKKGDAYASFEASDSTMISIYQKKLMLDHIGEELSQDMSSHQMVVCFEVDSCDQTYDELEKKGVKFVNDPKDMPGWGIRCFHILSPDNNLIEINEVLSKDKWDAELLKEEK